MKLTTKAKIKTKINSKKGSDVFGNVENSGFKDQISERQKLKKEKKRKLQKASRKRNRK